MAKSETYLAIICLTKIMGNLRQSWFVFASMLASLLWISLATAQTQPKIISGTVYDADTRKPISNASVQLIGSGRTTITNDSGQFRLRVERGQTELKFSHVAYYSEKWSALVGDSDIVHDASLHPSLIQLPPMRVYDRNYDPAQQVIIEAIRRKKQILAELGKFSCEAYSRMTLRDMKKPDSANIFMLTETQHTCYWELPDRYKEVIMARRQTANLKAADNLVTVGDLLNFFTDRISEEKIVAPTATDALNHYNYYLLDTVVVDSQKVFRLEIEPKNQVDPLFSGTIHIADSTYDVVALDLKIQGVPISPAMSNISYSQQCARFQTGVWMPIEIRFGLDFKLGMPFPGIPSDMKVQFLASLHNYSFDKDAIEGKIDEYILEIDESADKVDTSRWNSYQAVLLTTEEVRAYERIDSLEKAPEPLLKTLATIPLGAVFLASTRPDFFHFNRAEGVFLGVSKSIPQFLPRTSMYVATGYAIDAKYWQSAISANFDLSSRLRQWVSLGYSDQMHSRSTVVRSSGVMTIPALISKSDCFDYYRSREFSISGGTKIVGKINLQAGYSDHRQRSAEIATNYSVFDKNIPPRENPSISDGRMKVVGSSLSYDSRPLIRDKGSVLRVATQYHTRLALGFTDAVGGFDFRKYDISVFHRRSLFGNGETTIRGYFGGSNGVLPPQRLYIIEHNVWNMTTSRGFHTLGNSFFIGDRVAMLTIEHDFGRKLLASSGIPGLKSLPFTLGIRGGLFCTELRDRSAVVDGEQFRIASRAYREAGFSVGNLTPFLYPLNLKLAFTWQLSRYDTNDFSVTWGVDF